MKATTALVLSLGAMLLASSVALADMAGGPIYYNSPGALYVIGDPTNISGTQVKIGNTSTTLTDIAFDTDGQLYGISFSNIYRVSLANAALTNLGGVPYPANAMANYAPGQFYIALDGAGLGGLNGHFYSLSLADLAHPTDKGLYHDSNNEAGFRGTTSFLSAGDIWVTAGGTVYATINDGTNIKGWLVTVDPTNAEVAYVASLPDGTMYGIAESGGVMYLLDSTRHVYTVSGGVVVDTGKLTAEGAYGATAIPAPAAILLGVMGLGLIGWLKRRVG